MERPVFVSAVDLTRIDESTAERPDFTFSEDFQKLVLQLISRNDLRFPKRPSEARNLYTRLLDLIDNLGPYI